MVYYFRCSCREVPGFHLEVDVDAGHSFLDLHQALQSVLSYQPVHLASFVLPNGLKRKSIEITQLHNGERKRNLYSMQTSLVGDLLAHGKNILYYVFDLIHDRFLELELTGTNMEKNLRKPLVNLSSGITPVQVLDEEMTSDLFEVPERENSYSDYGVLDDYYEIFGEMEEYVL